MFLPSLTSVQSALPDTVVTLTQQDGIAAAADIAILVAALSVSILAFASVRALMQWDKSLRQIRRAARDHLGPVADRAKIISDNVEFITGALRTDVERLNASVKALTERLHQASDHMEERIEEFNALMELVQGEAEEIFLDTAAAVRGVREGARTIGRGRRGASPVPPATEGTAGDDAEDDEAFLPEER